MRRHAILAAAFLATLIGCSESPVAPDANCVLPETMIAPTTIAGMGLPDVHIAVRDAAYRVAPAVSGGNEIPAAFAAVEQNLLSADEQAICREVTRAIDLLDAQAATPATLPDRTALRMVLDLVVAVLRGGTT